MQDLVRRLFPIVREYQRQVIDSIGYKFAPVSVKQVQDVSSIKLPAVGNVRPLPLACDIVAPGIPQRNIYYTVYKQYYDIEYLYNGAGQGCSMCLIELAILELNVHHYTEFFRRLVLSSTQYNNCVYIFHRIVMKSPVYWEFVYWAGVHAPFQNIVYGSYDQMYIDYIKHMNGEAITWKEFTLRTKAAAVPARLALLWCLKSVGVARDMRKYILRYFDVAPYAHWINRVVPWSF